MSRRQAILNSSGFFSMISLVREKAMSKLSQGEGQRENNMVGGMGEEDY